MYLMHGQGGSERSWHDNDLYAHIQLDNLIAQGAVDPFIIVFTRNDCANWTGFGPILINELIPFVEGRYSVCANPANRALGGLSMGGMQTINFGFPNADKRLQLLIAGIQAKDAAPRPLRRGGCSGHRQSTNQATTDDEAQASWSGVSMSRGEEMRRRATEPHP